MSLLQKFNDTVSGPWETTGIDVQYRVKKEGRKAYVYFQGTVTWQDVKTDIDFIPVLFKPLRATFSHRGFKAAYESARTEIWDKLQGVDEIEAGGFSLGAALLTPFHADAVKNGLKIKSFAFGCPRYHWFPKKETRGLYKDFYRVRVRGDIVSEVLPPPWLGFRAVGQEIIVGDYRKWPKWRYHSAYVEELEKLE